MVTGVKVSDPSGIWGDERGQVDSHGKQQGDDLAPGCRNAGKALQNRGNACTSQRPAVGAVTDLQSVSPPPSIPWEIINHEGLATKNEDSNSNHATSWEVEIHLGALCL